MTSFLATFARQVHAQRAKRHGASKAPLLQALFFAWVGAHLASGLGPNP